MLAVATPGRKAHYATCRQPLCSHHCWNVICEVPVCNWDLWLWHSSTALNSVHPCNFSKESKNCNMLMHFQYYSVWIYKVSTSAVSSHPLQRKKIRELLVPESGGGGLMAGCTGLCSQSELSCRLLKIPYSEIIVSDCWWTFLMSHEYILNSVPCWDLLGAKPWKLFPWLITSDVFAVAAQWQ